MMKEYTEERTTECPRWLDLPEKQSYWVCSGWDLPRKRWWRRRKCEPCWRSLFYSREDAEAHAATARDDWEWDRLPAKEYLVSECVADARRGGDFGITIESYQDGAWRTVKEYPAGVPLPEEDQ